MGLRGYVTASYFDYAYERSIVDHFAKWKYI
jgi:hypothetical protein